MFKFFIPLSVSLIASASFMMPVKAELATDNLIINSDSSCSQSLSQSSSNNNNLPQDFQLAQIILDTRPSYDSRCSDWYTTIKYGKVYECKKCDYGGPYCWEKN